MRCTFRGRWVPPQVLALGLIEPYCQQYQLLPTVPQYDVACCGLL